MDSCQTKKTGFVFFLEFEAVYQRVRLLDHAPRAHPMRQHSCSSRQISWVFLLPRLESTNTGDKAKKSTTWATAAIVGHVCGGDGCGGVHLACACWCVHAAAAVRASCGESQQMCHFASEPQGVHATYPMCAKNGHTHFLCFVQACQQMSC